MKNVVSNRCGFIFENGKRCKVRPIYNIDGEKQ